MDLKIKGTFADVRFGLEQSNRVGTRIHLSSKIENALGLTEVKVQCSFRVYVFRRGVYTFNTFTPFTNITNLKTPHLNAK